VGGTNRDDRAIHVELPDERGARELREDRALRGVRNRWARDQKPKEARHKYRKRRETKQVHKYRKRRETKQVQPSGRRERDTCAAGSSAKRRRRKPKSARRSGVSKERNSSRPPDARCARATNTARRGSSASFLT